MRYLPVAHSGNQNCSPEEARAIATLVNTIMNSRSTWIDGDGQEKAITFEDIVIITPYNAQVFEIQQRAAERPCRHGRQVSGPAGGHRNLFDGNVKPCGRATRYGIPLQPQPAERRDLPRQVHIGHCWFPTNCRSRMPDAPANTVSQRLVPLVCTENLIHVDEAKESPNLSAMIALLCLFWLS